MAPEHDELIARAGGTGAGIVIRGSVWRGVQFFRRRPIDRVIEGLRSLLGRPNRWQSTGLDDLLGGMSVREFLLRFTLSHPHQSTTIVGTASLEHLAANVAVARKGPLPADVYNEARRRITRTAS
jgi:aryl-alcohol dehydrogenase-like predicted oxidoreductase